MKMFVIFKPNFVKLQKLRVLGISVVEPKIFLSALAPWSRKSELQLRLQLRIVLKYTLKITGTFFDLYW
jgi:hypothetical protein